LIGGGLFLIAKAIFEIHGEKPCGAANDSKGQNRTHALQQIRRAYAVRSIRVSISLRSVPKSIGLVSNASAPFSKAFRFVSASP